ncbi:FecR family protein [Algibacter sp. L1A34]|uniref:FecR family protein n=1 Tax=Algibacter sp. L1A34 TaxID=2686365 RepID=UPI00131ACABB|nr:FecR family protein [Algibacter sp. L1A34]
MTEKEFKILLDKFLNKEITQDELDLLKRFEDQAIQQSKEEVFRSDLEKNQIKKGVYKNIKKRTKPNNIFKVCIAASIVLLIGLGSMLFLNPQEDSELMVFNTSNKIQTVILADGSTVILNKNSSIEYKDTFNGTRYLELEGEAFFKICRNEEKPFVVKTKNVTTKVLGTSFNVADIDSIVNVVVATGLVEVSDANNSVLLKPNQGVQYSRKTQLFSIEHVHHELSMAWFEDAIYLEKISMKKLADFMKTSYGIDFYFISKDTENVQMSITIKRNESIENIIKKINYISELKLTLKANNMVEVK